MNQCIQVVDQMKAQYPLSKRPSTGSQGGLSPNGHRGSVAGDATSPCMQNLSSPSSLTSTSAIPPRSTSGADQGYGAGAVSLPQQEQPKKRGRPSRADKAKKDLRPMLPPRLAPRPQPVAAQRPLLPATSRSNGNSAQSLVHIAPNNLPAADEGMRDRKRMRLGGGLQDQQAGPSTANAASTVSSGAI
ncbi:hypothetical protein QQS21_012718 [Conoideocrella luteorostrata]|uniref:Uncharacterized protein n=1 Tax=Conoideocrella luteorostrata TaxID=1105319 RepID=A0AAJ0FM32_9HYPO|nr:hypothetical protein QQS21_012718 [Conoideocrella luteorostrata]